MDLLIDELSSPLGTIVIAACEGRLCGLDFGESRPRMLADLSARFDGPRVKAARDPFGIGRRIRAYMAGELAAIDDIAVDPGGTRFQRIVWAALRRVAPGTTVTYADLARRIRHPSAVRAVGAANGRNPVAIVIPCHRMIGSDGSLTGYGGGLRRKSWLLEHEGAIARDAGPAGSRLRPLASHGRR